MGVVELNDFTQVDCNIIIIVGNTGGGKSSMTNAIFNANVCKESSKMTSCTDDFHIYYGRWYGKFEAVCVIDSAGLLDSENRDALFIAKTVNFLRSIPENRIAAVVVPLPLMTRANSTYKAMIDQVELLFGGNVWDNLIFVTTMENQFKTDSKEGRELVERKKHQWERWLIEKCSIPHPAIGNFIYGNPSSLEAIRSKHRTAKPFTPATSAQINLLLQNKPGSTVNEIIEQVSNLKALQVSREAQLQKEIREKESRQRKREQMRMRIAAQQAQIEQNNSQISNLERQWEAKPKIQYVYI